MGNTQIRDTVFRHYFNGGSGQGRPNSRLLSLGNALRGTGYDSPEIIRLNTLDGSFFSSVKNDISMCFGDTCLILIEHQSTINWNMPLRLLNYVNELYRRFIQPFYRKIYEKTIIRLPAPEFHLFYDGDQRDFDQAIYFCRRHKIMADYLENNESEVIDMFGFEWNEQEERQALLEAGEARGIKLGKIASLRDLLAKGLITMEALKSSGLYSTDELSAISKP